MPDEMNHDSRRHKEMVDTINHVTENAERYRATVNMMARRSDLPIAEKLMERAGRETLVFLVWLALETVSKVHFWRWFANLPEVREGRGKGELQVLNKIDVKEYKRKWAIRDHERQTSGEHIASSAEPEAILDAMNSWVNYLLRFAFPNLSVDEMMEILSAYNDERIPPP